MSLQVRRTTNIEACKKLHERFFPGIEPEAGTAYWLVTDGTTLVGYTSIKVLDGVDKGTAFLSRSCLGKDYRGSGLQKRMIRVREQWARKHKINTLVTYVWHDNWPSLVNLIKRGFRLYLPSHLWAGREVLYLQKKLTNS